MRTVTIKLEITSCRQCPYFREGDRQSTDGFDSGNDWLCKKRNGKKIASFVEWHEVTKIEIPNWCPIAERKHKVKQS